MKAIIKYTVIGIFCSLSLSSCFKDLDTLPLSDTNLTGEQVYSTARGYKGALAKCYASLILTGQKGGDAGDGDVSGIDEGYSGYTRALFYLQDAASDQILLNSGSGHGTRSLIYLNWDPSTMITGYPYYRLYMAIGYCNEFLRESTEAKLKSRGVYEELKNDMEYYRAESRLIRAYCYSMICDLYGSGPFLEESMSVGVIPHQKSRKEIYDYVIAEGEALTKALKPEGTNEYGRVDQAAAWFLLSRVYLNAQTWVGQNEYANAYKYAKMVIGSKYRLAPDYRQIFYADNNTCSEIIWPLIQDANNAQSSAGTSFMIKALMSGVIDTYLKTGVGTRGWGNATVKTNLVNLFDVSDQSFDTTDPWGDQKKDKRAMFFTVDHTKNTWIAGKGFQSNYALGYVSSKWRNVTKSRQELVPGGTNYSSVDFPLFRTADAYLTAAEATLRGGGGSRNEALGFINEIRDRAYLSGSYGNGVSGRITDAQLTLDFILDERGREMYTELVRRTDLIRFGKFTKNYNWDWKGGDGTVGTEGGKDVSDKYNLFPIPQNEFTVNPNLSQNPEYK